MGPEPAPPAPPAPAIADRVRSHLDSTLAVFSDLPYPYCNQQTGLVAKINKQLRYLDYLTAQQADVEGKITDLLEELTEVQTKGAEARPARRIDSKGRIDETGLGGGSDDADPWS